MAFRLSGEGGLARMGQMRRVARLRADHWWGTTRRSALLTLIFKLRCAQLEGRKRS